MVYTSLLGGTRSVAILLAWMASSQATPRPGWDAPTTPAPVLAPPVAPTPAPVLAPPVAPRPAPVLAPPVPVASESVVGVAPPGPPPMSSASVEPPPAHVQSRHEVGPLRSGRAMAIAGFVLFGVAYVGTAVAGAVLVDGARTNFDDGRTSYERARREAVGVRAMVPVLGPFFAVDPAERALASVALTSAGIVQIVGLALGTVGAVRVARGRPVFGGYAQPLAGGASVHATLRF